MQRVDEYIRRAKDARRRAETATGSSRRELERIAEEWEYLAKERLEFLEEKLRRDSAPLN
jgi:hypothetical protein